MAENNDFALGYAMGNDSGGNSNGGFMGGWGDLAALLIIAGLFGWGGNGGFGFGGGGGRGGDGGGYVTRADLASSFSFNNLDNAVRGIQQGICDSTYALNNAITSGFHGVDSNLCNLSHALSDCCCTTQRAIDGVNYNMATHFATLGNTLCSNTRDIIENQNANTRSIMDFLVNDKISTLTAENQALKFAASQSAQNAFITANQEAQTAELIRRLGRDCPIPAYVVPNPNCCYGNPTGVGYGGGCGCGC